MSKSVNDAVLEPSKLFEGKRILLSGTTGFLGKVVLSMLLTRFPQVGRVYALIRPGPSDRAQDRFDKTVATSPALRPVAEARGEGFASFLAEKVMAVDGNITKDDCGLSADTLAMLEREGGVDLIINSAGLVDFDPAVDAALGINAQGTQNVVKLAQRLNAAVVHVSTCFVAGQRSGQIVEDEPVLNRLPDGSDQRAEDFDFQREIDRLQELTREVRARADDPATKAQWRKEAIARLEAEGRDSADEGAVRAGILRQKKTWLNAELKRVGMERSTFWGWTNTYTFTKALGEMVIAHAAQQGLNACIVRPAIVESALEFPIAGWNEGFTTTAPLILMVRNGLPNFPYAEDLVLDVIPCDMVAGVILAAGAACLAGRHKLVYQAASGDVNPLTIKKALELTAFDGRRRAEARDDEGLKAWLKRHNETQPLTRKTFERVSVPRFKAVASKVIETVDDLGPDRLGWLRQPASFVRDVAEGVETASARIGVVLDLFMPFVAENKYVFRCDNTRQLMGRIVEAERPWFHWRPESFVWRDYWLKVHIPGLEKWVLPELEEELAEKPKLAYMHRDLVELFESSTHAHRHEIAFHYLREDGEEHLTYGELRTLARRVSGFLASKGLGADDKVVLVCENRPEWVAAYFGILRAGLTAVPMDANAKANEVVSVARAAGAKGVLLSPRTEERLATEGLTARKLEGEGAALWRLADAVRCKDELGAPKQPARIASLIFTSGTTGKPKGVMLSHRNFTFEVSRLAGIFKLDERDHLLSVLPLHHTFEFTAGLLLPLSRGARITHLEELDGDMLQRALERGVTGLIGVPALWQLLQRRVEKRLEERSELVGSIAEGIKALNLFTRDRLDWNIGPALAYPVHRALGGRLKYLVSGGSALDPEVMSFFRGLGFNLTEGYGLTESAPVLTVTNPNEKVLAGSVGKPLHGVELRIDDPNAEGVGEVLARGPNVMLGYFNDEGATAQALDGGWLRTGDLGRLDADGRLFLVGRQKDVIVDADGRNVYPDELEEAYGKHACIKELSIVGLPQPDRGERVACLIVPDYAAAKDLARDEVRRRIQEHVRTVSDTLAYHKRIKVLHLVDHDLPRTSTRKVKRAEVIKELQRLAQASATVQQALRGPAVADGSPLSLARSVVAALTGKPLAQITPDLRLVADLGFDSLMFVELATSLEQHARGDLSGEQLMSVERVADLAGLLRVRVREPQGAAGGALASAKRKDEPESADSMKLPSVIASAGKTLLRWGQKRFYEDVMDVDVRGRQYVPRDRNFLVAANHASHLDAGLVKVALGDYGNNLVALAARDYFFGSSKIKRVYFENFTNLVPIERHGALKQSLRRALGVIERGQSLLIFPEGTRSADGRMQGFKPSIGYLALTSQRAVVPMYLWGTYDAMPKGSTLLPRARRIGVVIGPALGPELFAPLAVGRAKSETYRLATALVERAVHALRDEGGYKPEALLAEVLAQASVVAPRSLEASATRASAPQESVEEAEPVTLVARQANGGARVALKRVNGKHPVAARTARLTKARKPARGAAGKKGKGGAKPARDPDGEVSR